MTQHRIAGAPISWGVCEVPGWGYQLGPDRVLKEMREVGLVATELGPEGFLPSEPAAMANVLLEHGLQAVGGFTPLLLHVRGHDPVPEVDRILEGYVASGAKVLVLSAVTGSTGYDARPELDEAGWDTLLSNLDRVAELAGDRGVRAVLHPHVGTMIEKGDEVQQVLDGSWISLCLDTGHLLIGGTDPAELARQGQCAMDLDYADGRRRHGRDHPLHSRPRAPQVGQRPPPSAISCSASFPIPCAPTIWSIQRGGSAVSP